MRADATAERIRDLLARLGRLSVFHTPFAIQALAKLERGFDQDLSDVGQMCARGLTSAREVRALLAEIEPRLYLTPAVDGRRLRAAAERLSEVE